MEYSPRCDRFRSLLRAIRKEAGLSQAALAKKLGRPQSYVCKYEIGERLLGFLEIIDFCNACKIPLEVFCKRFQAAGKNAERKARPKRSNPGRMDAKGRVMD